MKKSYSEICAINGKKGGLARAKRFNALVPGIVKKYIEEPNLHKKEIADLFGVSYWFVNGVTRNDLFKSLHFKNKISKNGLTRKDYEILELELDMIIDLSKKKIEAAELRNQADSLSPTPSMRVKPLKF